MKKKEFLFNPNNPKRSFDVYIDKNPKDTIPIKYSTLKETKETIKKLEKLYKEDKYSHKRISQVAMILRVRLRVINENDPRTKLAVKYSNFLKERTKSKNRKKMIFKI
tara:strand:+ start:631 stop:954 length:324 start_codon:yes stop_codon:yes gene_type:complete